MSYAITPVEPNSFRSMLVLVFSTAVSSLAQFLTFTRNSRNFSIIHGYAITLRRSSSGASGGVVFRAGASGAKRSVSERAVTRRPPDQAVVGAAIARRGQSRQTANCECHYHDATRWTKAMGGALTPHHLRTGNQIARCRPRRETRRADALGCRSTPHTSVGSCD